MAAISSNQQQASGNWWTNELWPAITSHRGVMRFLNWAYEALAILAIPLTIACTFIIANRLSSPALYESGVYHSLSILAENGLNAVIEGSILGCIAIARKARLAGDIKWANTMGWLKWGFALLIILTVGFWVFKADQDASNVLLLVRCGAAVVFCIVAHTHNSEEQPALSPVQVATLEQRIQEQVAQIQAASSQTVDDVKRSIATQVASEVAQISTAFTDQVSQNLATLRLEVANEVAQNLATLPDHLGLLIANEVATMTPVPVVQDTSLSEQIGQLVGLVNGQAQIIQHLTNELAGVRREVRTTVTEMRSFTQETPALSAATPTIVDAESEPGERVKAFLTAWGSQKRPTLQQIMDGCQVAKRTATIHRDRFYGVPTGSQNEEEE